MPSITEKKNSPNHFNGRNGWKPDMICMHITEGGYSGAVSWLCNTASGASAHFVVARDGRIAQLVDLTNGSWCNGNSTSSSSRLYYKNSLNAIVRSRAANANYYTYSIEHEGYSYKDGYGALTEAQYQATLWLVKHIISENKRLYGVTIPADREHIIGHYEIDPTGKPSCPAPNKGANYPFARLIADLNGGSNDKANSFVGKHLKTLKDTTLYSTAGYSGATTSTLKSGTVVYCEKLHTTNGVYMALKDADKKDFLSPAAWGNSFDNFEITTYTPEVKVTEVKITNISTEIELGDTLQLSTVINPSNATNKTLTFKSNNEAVAKVNSAGLVTMVGVGSATITATATNGISGAITLTVYKTEAVYPFAEGTKIYPLEDIVLKSNAGYSNPGLWTLAKDTECIVDKYNDINGLYMALKNIEGEYFSSAWTNEFSKFTTTKPAEPVPTEPDTGDEDDNNPDNPDNPENPVEPDKPASENVLKEVIKYIVNWIADFLKKIFK